MPCKLKKKTRQITYSKRQEHFSDWKLYTISTPSAASSSFSLILRMESCEWDASSGDSEFVVTAQTICLLLPYQSITRFYWRWSVRTIVISIIQLQDNKSLGWHQVKETDLKFPFDLCSLAHSFLQARNHSCFAALDKLYVVCVVRYSASGYLIIIRASLLFLVIRLGE